MFFSFLCFTLCTICVICLLICCVCRVICMCIGHVGVDVVVDVDVDVLWCRVVCLACCWCVVDRREGYRGPKTLDGAPRNFNPEFAGEVCTAQHSHHHTTHMYISRITTQHVHIYAHVMCGNEKNMIVWMLQVAWMLDECTPTPLCFTAWCCSAPVYCDADSM